jgi:protein ImuB
MQRVVSIYLPTWSTDLYRRQLGPQAPSVEQPIVMIGRKASKRLVLAMDEAAAKIGLTIGMPVGKAQALIAGLLVEPLDGQKDAEALHQLALWLMRIYSPVVSTDGADGLLLDTTGADHLHGGEKAMLADMLARLNRLGFQARIAVAETRGAAYALARYGNHPVTIIETGELARAIADLPIEALRLEPEVVRGLKVLGLRRVTELLEAPRAPLVLRFGTMLGQRLDEICGLKREVIDPLRSEEIIDVRKVFLEPIFAQETILSYAGELAEKLCSLLERKALGARCVDMIVEGVDKRVQQRRISMARPVRNVSQLIRQLSDKLGDFDSGFGIELMRLVISHAEPMDARQIASNLLEDEDSDISAALDLIANRGNQVYRMVPVQSDVPERSVRCVSAFEVSPNMQGWRSEWPRPARLLNRPEMIQTLALLPDHPPRSFTWRGIRHQVQCADGPERIFGEWWKRDRELHAVRDYFRVEDEKGERFWIFRAGDGERSHSGSHDWFLHGIFG